MPRKRIELVCSVVNCGKPSDSKGLCRNHYAQFWRTGSTEKINKGDKRNHPLYNLWFERKKTNTLCKEWLDFYEFIKGISPKPEGNYLLIRIRNEPFGPTNFRWQEHLKRKEGETNKDWWARKRNSRITAHPSMESDRNIRRTFGLSREQYNVMLLVQNGVCAICEKPEISKSRTGGIKQLSVDHCHETGKIRGLLCWRCNGTLGKLEDNIELFDKMKAYLLKHKET